MFPLPFHLMAIRLIEEVDLSSNEQTLLLTLNNYNIELKKGVISAFNSPELLP